MQKRRIHRTLFVLAALLCALVFVPAIAQAKRKPTVAETKALQRVAQHMWGPMTAHGRTCYKLKIAVSTVDPHYANMTSIGSGGMVRAGCSISLGETALMKRGAKISGHWSADELGMAGEPMCTFMPWPVRKDLWFGQLDCVPGLAIAPADGPYFYDADTAAKKPGSPAIDWLHQFPRWLELPDASTPPGFTGDVGSISWDGASWGSDPVTATAKLTPTGSDTPTTPVTLTLSQIAPCAGGLVYARVAVTYNGTDYSASTMPADCTATAP